jgi:hypothetical protein
MAHASVKYSGLEPGSRFHLIRLLVRDVRTIVPSNYTCTNEFRNLPDNNFLYIFIALPDIFTDLERQSSLAISTPRNNVVLKY